MFGLAFAGSVAFYAVAVVGLPILGIYLVLRFTSKLLAKVLSKIMFVHERRSISRLLPDSKSFILRNVENEEQLTEFLKRYAIRNEWKADEVEQIPVWLLTGHLVTDANPSMRYR